MLSAAVERHVALMRVCGFVFDDQAELLSDYAAFADTRGDTHVRTEAVLTWSRKGASPLRRRTLYLCATTILMPVGDNYDDGFGGLGLG